MILDSLHCISHFSEGVSSSRLYRFPLAETVLHQSVQFGFLDVSAGKVLGRKGLAIRVYFGVRSLPKL